MRTVYCAPIERHVSALGFGCASLGSRISQIDGERALAAAFEGGITWYDVAPPYGDGRAEALLGKFLRGRRDQVVICTKVGIGRPTIGPQKALARTLLRPLVSAMPQFRAAMARIRQPGVRLPITPAMIEQSVVRSLQDLQTDHVDVLALHEPTPEECADPFIRAALERVLANGYTRSICIAGSTSSALAAFKGAGPYTIAQFADSPFDDAIGRLTIGLAGRAKPFLITHGIFGSGNIERLSKLQRQTPSLRGGATTGELLLSYALAKNIDGVVLASMFNRQHIQANCILAASPPRFELSEWVSRMAARSTEHIEF